MNYDSIIILGPTATGKTKISIELAKLLDTEIVNADSMYIYKYLDIGTAKPTLDEMQNIKHHLIGFVEPDAAFNVSLYRDNAIKAINEILAKNKTPIIVGGTGFYIDSLIKNYSYGETSKDESIRCKLEEELNKFGNEYLHNKLSNIDPESASKLHPNDTKRIIRALEIAITSNSTKSNITNNEEPILKNPLLIGLNIPREVLYDRINKRVDMMLENGLIDEVKNLYITNHLDPTKHQSMKGIGYKEIIDYLDGNCTLDEAINKIKQHTRNYAKRQITWFKRDKNIIWFNPIEDKNIATKIYELFTKKDN